MYSASAISTTEPPGQGHSERAELVRVDDDLVLAHHAADRRNLGDAGHGLQFVLQEPVLDAAQFGKIVSPGSVDEGVFEYPTDTRSVGPQRRLGAVG